MTRENWNHGGDRTGRFRGGKTKLEHANGTWRQRFANRDARISWQKDRNATNATFPGGAR
jgi:hypothetical protein